MSNLPANTQEELRTEIESLKSQLAQAERERETAQAGLEAMTRCNHDNFEAYQRVMQKRDRLRAALDTLVSMCGAFDDPDTEHCQRWNEAVDQAQQLLSPNPVKESL